MLETHLRGIWIALATFVPTFLAVIFGLPYLAGLPMTTRSNVEGQGCASPVVSSQVSESTSQKEPSKEMGSPEHTMRVGGLADAGTRLASITTTEALGNAAAPATPSARTRSHEPKAAEPLPDVAAIMRDGSWARGPAFLRKESAAHFAARMERVGFPTHVTRDDRRGIRWVVWIGNPHSESFRAGDY